PAFTPNHLIRFSILSFTIQLFLLLEKHAIQLTTGFIPLFILMFRITELRHKRLYGCRKKRLNIGTFF
ncbi:MAG: hypothetical protein OET81_11380, partial [Desulfobacteraceae bacterium]|nr:hypothetical protein [Desulfobacteraceae bacterium]